MMKPEGWPPAAITVYSALLYWVWVVPRAIIGRWIGIDKLGLRFDARKLSYRIQSGTRNK